MTSKLSLISNCLVSIFLAACFLIFASPVYVYAYGENCQQSDNVSRCFGSVGPGQDCSALSDTPICRCKETVSGSPPQHGTVAFCDSPKTFSDCRAFPDKSWVGVFKTCMNLGEALNAAIGWAIALAGVAALGRLAIGGVQYIISIGDPKRIEFARDTLTNAILGLILVLAAWLIARTLSAGFTQYGLPIDFLNFLLGPTPTSTP